MPEQEVAQVVDSLMHTGTDYPRLLKTERPNIVFFTFGEFYGECSRSFRGIPGVTPNLNQLAKEGVLFTNIDATGVAFRPRNGRCNQCRSFTSCRCYDQVSQ